MDLLKKAEYDGARYAVWQVLRDALIAAKGRRAAAASALGLPHLRALHRYVQRYHLLDDVRQLDREHGWRDYYPHQPRHDTADGQ